MSKNNKKGSVLLAVLCFTTVMLALATVAMRLSMFSNTTSTANVSKTQAEVTSENYLEQYISTFGGTYDDLNSIAGANKASAAEVTISIGGSTNVGDAVIYVYKDSGKIVVQSTTTYGGQQASSCAYFENTSITNPLRQSAIIANSGMSTGSVAMPIQGDMIIEGDPTSVVKFHNAATYHSNCYIESNVHFDAGGIKISDVADENGVFSAPQFFAEGYIVMSTNGSVEFTNTSAAPRAKDAYGNYTNENGFICTSSKFIGCMNANIGNGYDPIDVYSYGAYLGSVPQTYNADGVTVTNSEYNAINTVMGTTGDFNNGVNMRGNLYCYKTAASGQDGNLFINNTNGVSINGEVFVMGNIYLTSSNASLSCTGLHLSSSSKIYAYDGTQITDTSSDDLRNRIKINGAKYSSSLVGTINTTVTRNAIPVSDVPSTDCYAVASPNSMFLDSMNLKVDEDGDIVYSAGSNKTKNIASKFENSYNSWPMEVTDPSDSAEVLAQKAKRNQYAWAKEMYVDSTCTTSLFSLMEEAIISTDGNFQNNWSNSFKSSPYMSGDWITVYVKDDYRYDMDTIKSMPSLGQLNFGNLKINMTILLRGDDIVLTVPSGTVFSGQREKITVDKTGVTNGKFLYVMIYDKQLKDLSNKVMSGTKIIEDDNFGYYYATGNYGKGVNSALKYGRNYMVDKANSVSGITEPKIYFDQAFTMTEYEATGNVIDTYVYGTTRDCRTMFLLPDNTEMGEKSSTCKVNATIYSPNSDWKFENNNDQIFGAVICKRFYNNDNGEKKIQHIRYGDNSILGFVEWNASSTSKTDFLYFSKS